PRGVIDLRVGKDHSREGARTQPRLTGVPDQLELLPNVRRGADQIPGATLRLHRPRRLLSRLGPAPPHPNRLASRTTAVPLRVPATGGRPEHPYSHLVSRK